MKPARIVDRHPAEDQRPSLDESMRVVTETNPHGSPPKPRQAANFAILRSIRAPAR
jgi:hypothetical protein